MIMGLFSFAYMSLSLGLMSHFPNFERAQGERKILKNIDYAFLTVMLLQAQPVQQICLVYALQIEVTHQPTLQKQTWASH